MWKTKYEELLKKLESDKVKMKIWAMKKTEKKEIM